MVPSRVGSTPMSAAVLTVLLFCVLGSASASDLSTNTTALELCSAVAPYCQWNDTAIWAQGRVPGPNDKVSMDLRTTKTIIRLAVDSPVHIKDLIVLAEHVFCRIDISSSFEVTQSISAYRLHIGLSGQFKAPTVTLWKTEIYLMPLGQFEVDQSLTVTDGLVQLGLSGSGYFKINQATVKDATLVLATNGELKHLIQTGGALTVTDHSTVEAHTWSFVHSSYFHATSGSTITSLESLVANGSSVDIHSSFLLPAPNVSVTLLNCTGAFDHRLAGPSNPTIDIIGGRIALGGDLATASVVLANISISRAGIVSLLPIFRNSTESPWINANIDLFDYSELKVDQSRPTIIQGSLAFHDSGARFVLVAGYIHMFATPLTVIGDLTLNQTKLVVEKAHPSEYAVYVISHIGERRGKFADVISLRNLEQPFDVFVTELRYSQTSVAYYFHGQNWPGIGWGVLPVAILVAVAFVAITIFLARKIAFAKGENDVSVFGYSRV